MKILIVNTLYSPYKIGGAEISVQALAEEFSINGEEVGVLTLGKEDSQYILNDILIWRLKIENNFWPFDDSNRSTINKLFWHISDVNNKMYDNKIKKIFNVFKPDILFTNNLSGFSTHVWSLAKSNNIKIVHTLRDYYLQCPKTVKFKKGKNCNKLCFDCKMLSFLKKEASKNIDFVIGISNFVLQDHLKEGYFKDVPNQVIYNGFKFNDEIFAKKELPQGETIVFGYIGQLNKSKGVELLLNIFAHFDKSDKWKLKIAGKADENYLKKLKQINESKSVEFLGFVNSSDFFNKIDVLIVPSLWNEPFGRVVLEGIIKNKVVIGSNVGGIKELLSENPNFLFDPNDKDDLLRVLKSVFSNRNILQEFSFNPDKLSKFSLKNTSLQYLEVFKKTLA
ncbi:glycosyltransferase family 4 protein [Gaetbulibacter sp. M235]|uniref:glycosyltransferase family 4 protein n=1 Tax=Gaetbulibacter sp. M235 TaxID=3126510 RepID=UPI00374EE14F